MKMKSLKFLHQSLMAMGIQAADPDAKYGKEYTGLMYKRYIKTCMIFNVLFIWYEC
jgi:hypothetical protein